MIMAKLLCILKGHKPGTRGEWKWRCVRCGERL
ncbi:hypothetical protein SEA_CROSBY_11 [Streptomyces phage Crosby]|nr:hypothetical protein SEA_CROSBY_11 [Streptomyces phage Crosby]